MRSLMRTIRCACKPRLNGLLLAGALALGTAPAFASGPNSETIHATVIKDGSVIGVTLVIENFSSAEDLSILSQAFQQGQDRGLAIALSKTKAVGRCSISGAIGYDVAFIQMIRTPTGRQITFITNRPLQFGEADSIPPGQSYDLAVGRFELNDADITKSSGFLYPASKLVIDAQGEFHFDLAGTPWLLADVLDSKGNASEAMALGPEK